MGGPEQTNRDRRMDPSVFRSLGQVIENLCDDFEQSWKEGNRPRIEDYIGSFPESDRGTILPHLIGIEVFWRRQLEENPALAEYIERFPDARAAIGYLFQTDETYVIPSRSETSRAQETVMDRPATDLHSERKFESTQAIRILGNYHLIDEIGRGGMGIVYRAWQPSADRFVALKVIRRDRLQSLSRQQRINVIHRFRHEAQAAGRIEHDHIVTVYEVGEVDGEHFFSMRLVEGHSLFDRLQEGPLDARRAAQYIEPVARGLHEAHLHGILHRDLKPQNILIDSKTDRAMLVDFGLAKLAEEAEGATLAGDVMGTPAYMSPEQARDSSQVTAKSDVYSLGATLFHMLIGHPPFQGTTVLETIRNVVEQTPASPRGLNPVLDRDMDTICLKCLEKDPARRYRSAEALADDLRHYLNFEPIEARPVSPLEQAWRWCRRNPLVSASMAAAVLFLFAALVATTVGYIQTSKSLAIAEHERENAEQSERELLNAVDRFFTQVSENELMDRPGMQPLRQEFLEEAAAFYERFLDQRGKDPKIQDELAATHFRVGRIREMIQSIDQALASYQKAYSMQQDLVAAQPDNPARLAALGDTLNRLGSVLLGKQDYQRAVEKYNEAIKVRKQLVQLAPLEMEHQRKLANTLMNLALVERDGKDWKSASDHLEEAQSIRNGIVQSDVKSWEITADLATGHFNLATLAMLKSQDEMTQSNEEAAQAKLQEAMRHLEAAIADFSIVLEQKPNSLENKFRLATCYRVSADVKNKLQDGTGALELYELAKEHMKVLVLANPDVAEYRATLAGLHMNQGFLYKDMAKLHQARASYMDALNLLRPLVDEFPATPRYREDLEDLEVVLKELADLPVPD